MTGPAETVKQPKKRRSVAETIRTVRQARQYKPEPVPDDVLAELLEVARWTGSSRNSQPWHFIVITDKDVLGKIGALRAPIGWASGAPLGIALVLDGANATSEAYDEGRVTERLLIAARSRGLGGGVAWFGDAAQQAEGKRILSIPEEKAARSVVLIGYPASTKDTRPTRAEPGRKPLAELVSYNRMGTQQG